MTESVADSVRRSVFAAVLAGGRASRFGSDKALALFGGEPLLGRTLRLLGPQVTHLSVVAKVDGAPAYAALAAAHGAALLTDVSALKTPLAGLSAALDWCCGLQVLPELRALQALQRSEAGAPARLFAVAADMPFVADSDLLARLSAALDADSTAAAALAYHGGSLQTLAGLWVAPACAAAARALLAREKVGPRALLDRVRFVTVPFADEAQAFADADTPEALAALERSLR